MPTQFNRHRVVGQQAKADILPLQRPQNRRDDLGIEIFNGPQFQLQIPQMRTLVNRLHVQIHKIMIAQRRQRRRHLARIIGIQESRRPRHLHHSHAGAFSQPLDHVHRTDDRPFLAGITFAEGRQLRPVSGTPGPDVSRG